MMHNQAQSTAEQPLTSIARLEHSIADCEELLASMQKPKHPSAGRTKYLVMVRLANIRQQIKDMTAGGTGS